MQLFALHTIFYNGLLKEVSTLLKDLKLTKEYFYSIDLHDSMGKNNPKSTFQNQSTEKKNNFEGKNLVNIWVGGLGGRGVTKVYVLPFASPL